MGDIIIDYEIVLTGVSIVVGFIIACLYYFWYIRKPSRIEKFIENQENI